MGIRNIVWKYSGSVNCSPTKESEQDVKKEHWAKDTLLHVNVKWSTVLFTTENNTETYFNENTISKSNLYKKQYKIYNEDCILWW